MPLRWSIAFALVLSITAVGAAGEREDRFVEGYAAAILEREFSISAASLKVRDGTIYLGATDVPVADRQRVIEALKSIRGVTAVEIGAAPASAGAATAVAAPADLAPPAAAGATATSPAAEAEKLLPRDKLFAPLLADPKWPHFSASYRYYLDDDELENVGSANFGETFSFYRAPAPDPLDGQWELGVQAGVFAIFDFDAPSTDLINADYFVGLFGAYALDDFSLITRVAHQSSHLGDEFLLRNRIDRVNLSYERLDLLLSYDLTEAWRIYAGGGYIFHKEPDDLEPWSVQYGLEYQSPTTFWRGQLRPIAAVNLQHNQENDWNTDFSLRAGVQIESAHHRSQTLQLLIEYFNGYSPNGQFYDRKIEYIGIGLYLYL